MGQLCWGFCCCSTLLNRRGWNEAIRGGAFNLISRVSWKGSCDQLLWLRSGTTSWVVVSWLFFRAGHTLLFLDVRYRYSFLCFVSTLCPRWLYFLFTAAAVYRALLEWMHRDGKTVVSAVEFVMSTGQGKIGILAEMYFPRPSILIPKAFVILL